MVTKRGLDGDREGADKRSRIADDVDEDHFARLKQANAGNVRLDHIETPAFIVDMGVVEANCLQMQSRASAMGLSLRPHVKTHKTIEIAKLQVSEQTVKMIEVSTVKEALFYNSNGFNDILLATLPSREKLQKIQALDQPGHVSFLVDSGQIVDLVEACHEEFSASQPWRLFLKIDTGYHRAGADPESQGTIDLAQRIVASPRLQLEGIYSHAGHSYACDTPDKVKAVAEEDAQVLTKLHTRLKEAGVQVSVVSAGATPTCCVQFAPGAVTARYYQVLDSQRPARGCKHRSLTTAAATRRDELHPGNYVFYDRQQVQTGTTQPEQVAVSVLATVVAHYPERNLLLCDAGALALSKDAAPDGFFGSVLGSDLVVLGVSQEVAKVAPVDGRAIDFSQYPLGHKLRILPNHSCLAAACHPRFWCVRGGDQVEGCIYPCKFW